MAVIKVMWLGVAFVWCGVLAATCSDTAQASAVVLDPVLTLARVAKLECDPTNARRCWADLPAIHGVGVERFADAWPSGLLRYSKLNEREHERGRFIAALTPVSIIPIPHEQATWHRMLWLARRVVAGAVKSPCPKGTNHWGGVMDDVPDHWVRVTCSRDTGNRFYRVGGAS
jgi:hypothetical protein